MQLRTQPMKANRACAGNAGRRKTICLALFLAVWGLAGCKSVSQWVSPRVEGRVVDALSHEPIKDVLVKRVNANEDYNVDPTQRGGQVIARTRGVPTAADGTFVLDSVKDVALFTRVAWYSVTLRFDHPRYNHQEVGYTVADATNQTAGVPTIRTGDILLVPTGR